MTTCACTETSTACDACVAQRKGIARLYRGPAATIDLVEEVVPFPRVTCATCGHVWGAYEDTCHCQGPCHNHAACTPATVTGRTPSSVPLQTITPPPGTISAALAAILARRVN